jgi:hypothetical protein
MRSLVWLVAVMTTGLAAAQEPIAPAVEQADDPEVPPTVKALPPPPPPAPMLPSTPVPLGKAVLLPPPAGWRYRLTEAPPTRTKQWGLFSAGLVMLSAAWVSTLQAGIPTGEWRLDVPLFGPLLEMARIGGDGFAGFFDFLLVTDAAIQIGGFAMMLAGASTYKHKPGAQRIELVPLGAGAAVRGTF